MSLTDAQRASLWTTEGEPRRGLRIVSARAGSGKTSTLAQYVSDLLSTWGGRYRPWQGIAMLSYTNVARAELEAKLGGASTTISSYPHFVGTIDSFVNQFVFLPHGADAMGSDRRPRMVGEPHSIWQPKNGNEIDRFFDGVGYGLDAEIRIDPGALAWTYGRKKEWVAAQAQRIRNRKRDLNRRRYATQADANFFALRALTQNPRIARALVGRFPVVIVDESQDMTEAQHALLDALVGAGLSHAVLIGDEWQAIYEWNTAKPDLFVAKLRGGTWQPSDISGSFRCSPRICDALNSLAGDVSLRPVPGSKNASYGEPVRVEAFDANARDAREKLSAIIDGIAALLSDREPHAAGAAYIEVALLARGREDAAYLRSLYLGEMTRERPTPPAFLDKRTKAWLGLVYYAVAGNVAKALVEYERLLAASGDHEDRDSMRGVLAEHWFGPGGTVLDYRKAVVSAIARVRDCFAAEDPATLSVSKAASACDPSLIGIGETVTELKPELEKYNPARPRRGAAPRAGDIALSLLFGSDEPESAIIHPKHGNVRLTFSTIHGVKGETYDGVVFTVRKRTANCGCDSPANLSLRIAGHNILLCEGKRLQYVAASRAAQLLIIAAEGDHEAWRDIFCRGADRTEEAPGIDGAIVDVGMLTSQSPQIAHQP